MITKSSLALTNIHCDVDIDYKRAVKILSELLLRKLNVSNLIFHEIKATQVSIHKYVIFGYISL